MSKKVVLCLDGGGVRGKFSFGICNLLSQASDEPLSTAFDLVCATSVGSFIGGFLTLGMLDDKNTQTAIYNQIYAEIVDIFRAKNKHLGMIMSPQYDGSGKRSTLMRIFGNKKLGDVKTPFAVVCATFGGRPHVFKSWDKSDRNLLMVDVLDASSAAPIYFPPVRIGDHYYVDGGIVSNKPIIIAYLCARELFSQNPFKILSIGTMAICELKIEPEEVNNTGIISWLGYGLIDILTGVADDTPILLMNELLGPYGFRRIHCDCGTISLDDMSGHADMKLQDAITHEWKNHGAQLLAFISRA